MHDIGAILRVSDRREGLSQKLAEYTGAGSGREERHLDDSNNNNKEDEEEDEEEEEEEVRLRDRQLQGGGKIKHLRLVCGGV